MLRRSYVLTSIAFALSTLAATDAAAAQRTFVASNGATGNKAFNCSIDHPCRQFSEAISVTDHKGEVIVRDSAGYGTVTITQSVSIIAPAGVYAGITVFAGVGVTVNGSNINVVLRGLTINGQGGNFGIQFLQGARLTVEDCEIANMVLDGISASAANSTVTVKNTVIRDNGFLGIDALGPHLTVTNSVLANNTSAGLSVGAPLGSLTDVMVTRSTITGGSYGLTVDSLSGGIARLVSDGNVINNTTLAAFRFHGGIGTEVIYTSGNNTVGFNNAIVTGGVLTSIGTH